MIKVMHVLNTGKYSGAENVAITIINSLKGYIDATYVSPEGPIKDFLDENDITYYPVKKITITEVKNAIKQIQPDIIHAHDFTAGIICVATGTKVPIVNHIHNNSPWIKHYNLNSFIYAASCLRYKKILTVSNSVMDEYVFGRYCKNKTEVIGNPVDINKIRTLAGNVLEKKYDIAFLGRLSSPKNPKRFIDIIANLKRKLPDVKVIMIGDGELKSEVVSHIENTNLQNTIKMVGFQKNPYAYLNQAKILLMPSLWEGFGLAAVEALALGIPVVCSNVGGLPDIVNKDCGSICTDTNEYVDSSFELLTDENKYFEKSKNATNRISKIVNDEEYNKRLFNIYSSIMQSK